MPTGREELAHALLLHVAAGTFEVQDAVPALRALAGEASGPIPTRLALLQSLRAEPLEGLGPVVDALLRHRFRDAETAHTLKASAHPLPPELRAELADLPLDVAVGWRTGAPGGTRWAEAYELLQHRLFLAGVDASARLREEVEAALGAAARRLGEPPAPASWSDPRVLVAAAREEVGAADGPLLGALERRAAELERAAGAALVRADEALAALPAPLASEVPESALVSRVPSSFRSTADPIARRARLDLVLAWPTAAMVPALLAITTEAWAQEHAMLVLTLRFGRVHGADWRAWTGWLRAQEAALGRVRPVAPASSTAVERLLVWELQDGGSGADVRSLLEAWACRRPAAVRPQAIVDRWRSILSTAEVNAILGTVTPTVPPPPIPPLAARPPAPPPAEPPAWQRHVQGFFAENWYMVAGVLMVVVGSSLLAYFTWDRNWLLRYTIVPVLLGAFTATLALTASWLEKKDPSFVGTGATLRGAAIALLPANFMAVALLAHDPQVTRKLVAVPAMTALYLLLFGPALVRWSRAVHPRLGFLGLTLLALDSLVLLEPLGRVLLPVSPAAELALLPAGFYAGFAIAAWTVQRFTRDVMDREMALARRVPWFVGAVLVITYLEVFTWVHGSLRYLPQPATYAPLVILAGGLVLHVERRFLALAAQGAHAAESFLGFALVGAGLLMGAGHPYVRVLSFALAGAVWLYQAGGRGQPLHHWIGTTLLVLAGASVGLLPGFPRPWLPALGLALALTVEAAAVAAPRSRTLLRQVCREMHLAILMITAAVAVLAQWHYRSWPLATAGVLAVIAALFARRAHQDQSLRWLHTAMALLALALPYLGFVDMEGRRLQGNTMVFGLALLSWAWIALVRLSRSPLLVGARSTVLWMYGALGLTAMALRVIVERGHAAAPLWTGSLLEYGGPLLMAGALAVATYHSRSIVPAAMAAVIVVVLLPSLKATLLATFPQLGWGTGYGSAWIALVLLLLAFRLREAAFLRDLGEGDLFLGREPFPLRRFDHTLFTGPLVACVIFLAVKIDTWTVLTHLDQGLPARTGIALIVTGVVWTLLAAFLRRHAFARVAVHIGWLVAAAGVAATYQRLATHPRTQWPIVIVLVLLQAAETGYHLLRRRHPWANELLETPTRAVVHVASLALSVVIVGVLLAGRPISSVHALSLVVALELARQGLARRTKVEGAALFLLAYTLLLAFTAPGPGELLSRLSTARSLGPTLAVMLGVQLLLLVLEWAPPARAALQPLAVPAQAAALGLASGVGLWVLNGLGRAPDLSRPRELILLAAVLLTARAERSGALALLGALLAYVALHHPTLRAIPDVIARADVLLEPWRWSLFALALAVLAAGGREVKLRLPPIVAGAFPLFGMGPASPWLEAAAVGSAALAALDHTVSAAFRADLVQLPTPYLGALTVTLVGWSAGWTALFPLAAGLVATGNVHAVRLFAGDLLRARGVSDVHLVALGLFLTLLQGTLLRALVRSLRVTAFVHRASLVLGAAILTLLSTNYFAHPDLEAITPLRFVISGVMALAAGWYFRRAARDPGPDEARHVEMTEGLYHYGVAVAGWCAALLVPWLRRPSTALIALALPAVYFWARAELGLRERTEEGPRYRNSAAVLGFVLLALYALRPVFQMVLFPETRIHTDHYHHNALFVMVLGLLLMRLHALGGTEWLAFYGGLALMAGSYFALTAWPGLSPFEHPIPAAWSGVAVAHFWTVASDRRSPLRAMLQGLAALDDERWVRLRAAWGRCVLGASQFVVLLGLLDYPSDTYMVAPLLLGAASVLVHQGVLTGNRWYHAVAIAEVFLALHADFFVPSWLDRRDVLWVLLLIWAALLLARRALSISAPAMGGGAGLLALAVMAHVAYHRPWSDAGLWAAFFAAMLAALTPRDTTEPSSPDEGFAAALLLAVPVWLVYFSQAAIGEEGPEAALRAWPLLAATATLFLIGAAGRLYQPVWETDRPLPNEPRLFHQVQALLGRYGARIHTATLWIATLVAGALQLLHYGSAFAVPDLALLCALYAGLAFAWYQQGREGGSTFAFAVAELCLLALFALGRRQLLLTTSLWSYEYDVWASLAASFVLAGAKQAFDDRPREMRLPVTATLLALPVIAIVWTLVHHLGTDVALVVVGLHSLMFAYVGRERSDSPYNLAALAGFVAFLLIIFWTKLHLRVLHAYVIPVGLAVLALLHVFGRDLPSGTRNRIRLVTTLSMLGSAAYYALVDDRHPLAFNVTLLLLCLAAMALGSATRVRAYIVLGFAGVTVDLVSIVVKVLTHMDRGERMTSVGVLVLLLGAALVGGAVYYKTHRDELDRIAEAWRARLAAWD